MAGSVNKVILVGQCADLYRQGWSTTRIARHLHIPISRARGFLLDASVQMRSRSQALLMVDDLNAHLRGRRRQFTPEWKANIAAGRQAWGAANAKGTSRKPSGYIEHTRGAAKGKAVHRQVAETMLGRALMRSEVVHHTDRNRANNDPSNLLVMTRAEHTALHRREDRQSSGNHQA